MAGKSINIENINELDSLLNSLNVDRLSKSLSRANEEVQKQILSQTAYKDVLEEIARLEKEIGKEKDDKKRLKLEKDLKDYAEKHKKTLTEIKEISDNIIDDKREELRIEAKKAELRKEINKDLIEENRILDKQLEWKRLDEKSIKEGLTWDERRKMMLEKIGETIHMNTDKFRTGMSELKQGFNDMKSGFNEVKSAVEKFNEPWAKIDQAAADFTKRIGGSAESMKQLRKTTIDFMETRNIGIKYNTSMEELVKLQGDYNANLGRSISLTDDQMETMAAMKKQGTLEFSTKLENFGLNPDEVGKRVGDMFSKASKSGIAFEKYSKNFLDNIKLAQNYNFQNGLRGLDAMARKATAIKLDMQQVANFANKVSTLEGAMTSGAQLSVLGGDFARFGNPLSMMYEGLNDMEGLQDRMVNMFGKMGNWDYSKGQVDVSVFNKQRIKAAAEATGMDYSSLMEMINSKARRNIVESKLGSNITGDEELKELVLNKAQLDENGGAYITINGKRKDVNKINESDKDALRLENNSDSDNIREIAVNTRGYKDVKEGFDKQKEIAGASVNEMSGIGNTTKELLKWTGEQTNIMRGLATIDPALSAIKGVLGFIHGGIESIIGLMVIGGAFGSGGGIGGNQVGGITGGGNQIGTEKTWDGKEMRIKNGTKQVKIGGKWAKMGAGTKIMNGVSKYGATGGAIAGVAGGLIDAGTSVAYMDKQKDSGYVAGKAIGRGLELAGTGAMIGSMTGGPVGALVGAGIGAVVGGIWGGVEANNERVKEEKANTIKGRYNAVINDPSIYSKEELDLMMGGAENVPYRLKNKMLEHNDYLEGFKSGGYTGKGNPNEVAGVVHKGELVLPNEVTKEVIKPNGDLMNNITVSTNGNTANTQASNKQTVSFEPINININGKLDLTSGGVTKSVSAKDVMTPEIIDQIIKQIQIRTNYALDRDKTHIKYG